MCLFEEKFKALQSCHKIKKTIFRLGCVQNSRTRLFISNIRKVEDPVSDTRKQSLIYVISLVELVKLVWGANL